MRERIDYDRVSAVYDEGRAFPAEWLHPWREAMAPYLGELVGPVLDLGSGTGIWSPLLSEWFNVEVVGVEPSEGMRAQASLKRLHPGVRYVGGTAEHVPLKDDACAAAWISTVVHHISDLDAGVREVRRVVGPGGPVLIRGAFSGRHQGIEWMHHFPSARPLADRRHLSVEATVRAFSGAGLALESLHRVTETSASSLDEYVRRIQTRADSTLALISDEEFERGLADLRRAARTEPPAQVLTTLDLLVLR